MKKQQYMGSDMKTNRHLFSERPWFFAAIIVATFIAGMLVTGSFRQSQAHSFLCSLSSAYTTPAVENYLSTPAQLNAILHYATTRIVPQQSYAEISLTFNVLKVIAPCNFLVFGLGHDSLMWDSFNPRGTTLFLEEDPKWVQTVLQRSPSLHAHVVKYPTRLSEADHLFFTYKKEKDCMPGNARLKGETRCRLALNMLPEEVLDREWDVIMIDAPRGYFAEAPGRMGAIFSAAVMARGRSKPGVTHVYLHDVNRRVEKIYAREFLCKKHLVKATGRLWHFEIPPAANMTSNGDSSSFC